MLDSNFILKIGKEKIQHYKNINTVSLPAELQDPYLYWVQNDPDKSKENCFLAELKKVAEEICSKNTLIEQKRAIKTAILNFVLSSASLFFILLYPKEEDHNNLRFFPFTNLNSSQLDNYLNFISSNDQYFKSKGITNEKTFQNSAVIAQVYSVSNLIYLTLEECALNIGISNIKEKNKAFVKIMVDIIYPSIKNNNLNINPFDQLLTNQIFMKFIEEE